MSQNLPCIILEKVATHFGQDILHLPPYHCELDPTDHVWATEKNHVTKENKRMELNPSKCFLEIKDKNLLKNSVKNELNIKENRR